MNLTATTARTAESGEAVVILRSARVLGLTLEIRPKPSTRRTFYWRGRVRDGQVVAVRIGDFGAELTVAQAEVAAAECLRSAKSGVDPRAQRERARAEQREADAKVLATFGQASKDYLAAHAKGEAATNSRRAPKESGREGAAARRAVEIIGADTTLASIGLQAVLAVKHADPEKAGSTRRHTWGAASRILSHAVEHGLIETNPFRATVKPPLGSEPRARYLAPTEIAAVWGAAGELGAWGDVIRLLVAIPLRLGNATDARWRDVRGDVLHLPNSKNGLAWPVPMTTQAQAILAARRADATDPDGLIFVSSGDSRGRGVGGPLGGVGKVKDRLDKLSGVADWRIHDLRRTIATTLSDRREDVDPFATDLWLQHKPGGMRGVYNVSASVHATRKVAAMWSAELGAILTEHKVAGAEPPAVARIGEAAR